MRALTNNLAIRQEQGFPVYTLSNEQIEAAVVPELGAKIISLKNLVTGREWLWHPLGGLKLFRNHPADDFAASPLVGIDECLPTIAPCLWQGRHLPDHGEVWSAAWEVDTEAWANGLLKTSTRLKISPFTLERTIELLEDGLRLSYRLTNHSRQSESYLWAIHPLLRLQPGDQLEIPESTRALFSGVTWLNDLENAAPTGHCIKIFASPVKEGYAAIANQFTGERLEFEWQPEENNTLGLWLTRGGWHGHQHFAIEPTNGAPDELALAAEGNCCGVVSASGSASWQLNLRVRA